MLIQRDLVECVMRWNKHKAEDVRTKISSQTIAMTAALVQEIHLIYLHANARGKGTHAKKIEGITQGLD